MRGKTLGKEDVEKVEILDPNTLNTIAEFFRMTIPLAPVGDPIGPWLPVLCVNKLTRPFVHEDLDSFAVGELYQYCYEKEILDEEQPRIWFTLVTNKGIRSIAPVMEA